MKLTVYNFNNKLNPNILMFDMLDCASSLSWSNLESDCQEAATSEDWDDCENIC